MILIDSSVLLDLASRDPVWGVWSRGALAQAAENDNLAINPIIYAETSVKYGTLADLDLMLEDLGIARLNLPYSAAFLAGRAFVAYRKRGGARTSPLPDFYIGAHAAVAGMTLLTRDPRGVRTYFPRLQLIAPEVG